MTQALTLSIEQRLQTTRNKMRALGVQALWVRSSDRYLNEYVPKEDSTREWLTGFDGSAGEALLTADRCFLFVDGRYHLQAEQQVSRTLITVVKVVQSSSLEQALLEQLVALQAGRRQVLRVGFEATRVSVSLMRQLSEQMAQRRMAAELIPLTPSPVEQARAELPPHGHSAPQASSLHSAGEAPAALRARISKLSAWLQAQSLQAYAIQPLDEIAYLTGLRGDDFALQSTFRAQALLLGEQLYVVLANPPDAAWLRRHAPHVHVLGEADLTRLLRSRRRLTIGFAPESTSVSLLERLQQRHTCVAVSNPIAPMKAVKEASELVVIRRSLAKADLVMAQSIAWACRRVALGQRISEYDVADYVAQTFEAQGARKLSFSTIVAAGKNGAVVHYSHPSKRRWLKLGELLLIDCGAYFEGGYATDLTRTFLLGPARQKASAEQRLHFTRVLRAAIAGMSAVVPEGVNGQQLDAIVRAPLWQEGLDYAHGTGHGVGIGVHEAPPRVSCRSVTPLRANMLFSIEPGLYFPRFGGIRIENLCLLEALPGGAFLRVTPLTYAPLDARLIDLRMLSATERVFLSSYTQLSARRMRLQTTSGL